MSFFYQRMPARPWVQSLALLIFFALTVSPASAQKSTSAPEIAEKRADLDGLRQRIDSLRKELSSNEGTRADAADRLRESERQISRLQRQLHDLGSQRSHLQSQLTALETQSRTLASTLFTCSGLATPMVSARVTEAMPRARNHDSAPAITAPETVVLMR